ncbi:MAG: protein kinase domain-containing protein, partial [Blastocatellia bacterium]
MPPERWQQIEELYHAALERAPDERGTFLDQACAGDEELRREVASLLDYDDKPASFIESPVLEVAARELAGQSLSGTQTQALASPPQISGYQLLAPLGRGGMGEVYLALDTRLNRKVAIKLLPAEFTTQPERVRRFAQEARAASALNHPNIITIHEIGEVKTEVGDTHYIVTEYVEGETLRQRMMSAPQSQMQIAEAIDIAAQVAAALTATHEAGIVHRDIKPENVMVRRDGYVKVLDFGLAKLTEPSSPAIDTQAPTVAGASTDTGLVMGTLRYMSPEQARGEKVDARADIFSLGVLMYEMIAGRAPFKGTTPGEMIAAILRDSPPPLAECASVASRELEQIINKTLRKDRAERYQTARDLLTDLKELKRRIEFGTRLGKTAFAAAARRLWPRLRSRRIILAASVAVVGLIVALSYFHLSGQRKQSSAGLSGQRKQSSAAMPRSIAVLPFKPLVADNRDEALELGMADTLITKLSNLNQIIIRPTSAVRRYAALDQDPLAAGREQQVETVLEGNMYLSGEKIRVTVRLLDVRDGSALWTYQCTEYCTDIFAAQDLISEKVARALAFNLTGEQRRRLAKRYTENIAAYELYLEGRYFWEKRTEEDLKRAIGYFKQAIAVDPNYALAYAGIAHCYGPLAFNGHLAPDLAAPQMKVAAMKAIDLDDTLAEAHTALA